MLDQLLIYDFSAISVDEGLAVRGSDDLSARQSGWLGRTITLRPDPAPQMVLFGDDRGNGDGWARVDDAIRQMSRVMALPGLPAPAGGLSMPEQTLTLVGSDGAVVQLHSVEMGDDLAGFAASVPLRTGITYTITAATREAPAACDGFVLCFAATTLIRTAEGDVPAGRLSPGTPVLTMDEGYRPILWIGSRHLDRIDLAATPALRPVRIRAGALGMGLPESDLVLAPQHRVLVRSRIARQMFACDEVLVPASQLVGIDGIEVADDLDGVDYVHILFDRHQIIFVNGAPAESLFTGPDVLAAAGQDALLELHAILPELAGLDADALATPARPMVPGRRAPAMALDHREDRISLIAAE